MRSTGEALGCYLGKYLAKDWEHRLREDKGARCIRYFGHWSKMPRQIGQGLQTCPQSQRFGWIKPRARAWREMVKQLAIVLAYKGVRINEENMKEIAGRRWAWKATRLFRAVRFVAGDWQDAELREAIGEHNEQVRERWLAGGGNPAQECWWDITEITLDHLRPSPAWQKQMNELQQAKDCEAESKRRLRAKEVKGRSSRRQSCERADQLVGQRTWATWIERTAKDD